RFAVAAPLRGAVGGDGQVPVAVVAQPALPVAQAVLVGDQLDVALATEGVQLLDLGAGQRAGLGQDVLVTGVGERVLHVHLDLVDLPGRQPVDKGQQRLGGRDLVARDVEHDAPNGQVGPVLHRADR